VRKTAKQAKMMKTGPRFRLIRETRSVLNEPVFGTRIRSRLVRTPGIGSETGLVHDCEECDLCWRSSFSSIADEWLGRGRSRDILLRRDRLSGRRGR